VVEVAVAVGVGANACAGVSPVGFNKKDRFIIERKEKVEGC